VDVVFVHPHLFGPLQPSPKIQLLKKVWLPDNPGANSTTHIIPGIYVRTLETNTHCHLNQQHAVVMLELETLLAVV